MRGVSCALSRAVRTPLFFLGEACTVRLKMKVEAEATKPRASRQPVRCPSRAPFACPRRSGPVATGGVVCMPCNALQVHKPGSLYHAWRGWQLQTGSRGRRGSGITTPLDAGVAGAVAGKEAVVVLVGEVWKEDIECGGAVAWLWTCHWCHKAE
jgi:hypothetical protein